jgi:hypothetical protein
LGLSILALLTPWEALLYIIRTPSGLTLQQVTLTWNVVWVTLRAAHPPQLSFIFGLSAATSPQRAPGLIPLAPLYTVSAAKLVLLATGALLIAIHRQVRIGGALMLCAPALGILSYAVQLATSPPNAASNQLGLIVIPIGLTLSALVGILATMRANSYNSPK